MPIPYALFENHLTSDPDDYMALVQPVGAADLDTIIDRMMQQGSTTTRADTLSVLEDFFTAVERLVLAGANVNTPIANFGASVKGVFNGRTDGFDPSRHQLAPTVAPGKRLRATMAQHAQPAKQESIQPAPNPLDYIDIATQTRNATLTPGGMGQIVGHRLKFDPADTDQGVFFINSGGVAVRVTTVGRNKPADLMFIVPDSLTAGAYTVEVRVLFATSDIRTGTLAATLTAV